MTLPGILQDRVYVVDTSGVLDVRRLFSRATQARLRVVYERLAELARDGTLVFPHQIIEELIAGHEVLTAADDAPYRWAQDCRTLGVPDSQLFDDVRAVLVEAPKLVDHARVSRVDEADPYVVGLALQLRRDGRDVRVIANDRSDTPEKTSIQSACGLLGIPALSMQAFLTSIGVELPI